MADALVRELNKLGYQPVFLPRSGVKPPELYSYVRESQRLVRLGELAEALPAVKTLKPTKGELGNIELHYTSSKKLSGAVNFLQAALQCIGIGAVPKLDLRFAGANEFSFALTGLHYLSVDPLRLNQLLADLNTTGIPAEHLEEGRLHVAYEYAYASELLMSRGDKADFEAGVEGKVGEFIDLGGKGSVSVASSSTLKFKGAAGAEAAFAYKAGRLVREGRGWAMYPEQVMRGGLTETKQPFVPQPAVVLTVE
ncbi:hypothetical protein [Ideonella sp. YS5]|uniref:hypothetical protein n=1 Tax=Ideonella sp. YS5 TaxID=3453714 RepID=UPI003EEEAB59